MRLIKCAHCKETSKSPSRGVQWGVKNKITSETSFWMLVKGTKSGETWASSSWECGGNFLVLGEKNQILSSKNTATEGACADTSTCSSTLVIWIIDLLEGSNPESSWKFSFWMDFCTGFFHELFREECICITWVSLIQKQISKYNEYFYSKISKLWLLNLLFLHTQY